VSFYVYGLTALTGRKRNQGRKVVVNGFEFGRRSLLLFCIGLGISIVPAAVASAVFGPLGFIIVVGVVIPGTFFLVEGRGKGTPDLPLYKSALDRRKWKPQLTMCHRPIDLTTHMATIRRSSVTQVAAADSDRPAPVWASRNKETVQRTVNFLEV
jgi:hypothetical protein